MKYHVIWELDNTKVSADLNERRTRLDKARLFTEQYFKEHPAEDWGAFPGENKGYWTGATKWEDLVKVNLALAPYYTFQVHPAISLAELVELWKTMAPK